jgi:hypothetical protein
MPGQSLIKRWFCHSRFERQNCSPMRSIPIERGGLRGVGARVLGSLLMALCLLSSSIAVTADYTISFALDAGGVNDWGKSTCEYATPCEIVSRRTKLSTALSFVGSDRRNVTIRVASQDEELDCCYFATGARRSLPAIPTAEFSPPRWRSPAAGIERPLRVTSGLSARCEIF